MRTEYAGWGAVMGFWLTSTIVFCGWLFSNLIAGTIMGAATGWLVSLTFLGRWIAEGLAMAGVDVPQAELFKLGAAAGFFSGFLKHSVGITRGLKN